MSNRTSTAQPPETGGGGEQRQRIQIDFSPTAMRVLAQIKMRSGASTNAEVVRNALRLYDWFLGQKLEGAKIHVVSPDGSAREVEFMF